MKRRYYDEVVLDAYRFLAEGDFARAETALLDLVETDKKGVSASDFSLLMLRSLLQQENAKGSDCIDGFDQIAQRESLLTLPQRALFYLERSQAESKLLLNTKALKSAQKALELYRRIADSYGQCRSYLLMGISHLSMHSYEKSIRCFNDALKCCLEDDPDSRLRAVYNRSSAFLALWKTEDAMADLCLAEAIVQECRMINESETTVSTHGAIFRTPLGHLRSTHKVAQFESAIHLNISEIWAYTGHYTLAIEEVQRGISIAEFETPNSHTTHWRHQLATYLYYLGEYDIAYDLSQTNLNSSLASPDLYTRAAILNLLGLIEIMKPDRDLAVTHLCEAAELFLGQGDNRQSAIALQRAASLLWDLGEESKSQKLSKQVSKIEKSSDDQILSTLIQLAQGESLCTRAPNKSLHLLRNVVSQAEQLNIPEWKSKAYQSMAQACIALRRYSQAVSYMQLHQAVVSELSVLRSASQLRLLSIRHETELLRKDQEVKRAERRVLEQRLETLEEQLASKTTAMLEQARAYQHLRVRISESTRELQTAEQIIRKVKSILNESPLSGSDWDALHRSFTELYPGFVSNLHLRCPRLSKMETRICILIRSGMKSIDMAELLSLSLRNIENHRYRLRKKLNLDAKESLEVVLSTIQT